MYIYTLRGGSAGHIRTFANVGVRKYHYHVLYIQLNTKNVMNICSLCSFLPTFFSSGLHSARFALAGDETKSLASTGLGCAVHCAIARVLRHVFRPAVLRRGHRGGENFRGSMDGKTNRHARRAADVARSHARPASVARGTRGPDHPQRDAAGAATCLRQR